MTLVIETPSTRHPEREYIFGVLLGEFFGLSWRNERTDRSDVRITMDQGAGEILLPDVLFSVSDSVWLTQDSMPDRPLLQWDTRELSDEITLVEDLVPVLYGDALHRDERDVDGKCLPIDIFGSAFFMLTRYEEMIVPDRDEHARFPARASIAYQEGFLGRPIVDEYVEILWAAMKSLWPGLERKRLEPETFVTCDVDSAIAFRGGLQTVLRRLGGDIVKRRSPALAARTAGAAWRVSRGDINADPDWMGLQWIMQVNEQVGNSVAFYFIPEITDRNRDRPVSLTDHRTRALLRNIHERGHEVGIHPGYETFKHPDTMVESVEALRQVMAEEGIRQPIFGGRQHYLRWKTPTTARLLEECHVDYDTTLSYADVAGFRCGSCREYPFFDLETRGTLKLRERPLIVMERSVIDDQYQGMGYSDKALGEMIRLRERCHQFNGRFTLLWHNSHLRTPAAKWIYRTLIGAESVMRGTPAA